LLKINPNLEEAKKHLTQAEHDFEGIMKFKEIGFSDWSIAAGFYCIYHNFLAIAAKFGYESSNQTCTIALIKYLNETGKIIIDDKYIEALQYEEIEESKENSVIELREDYTYGVKTSVKDETRINKLRELCKGLIDITKEIIFK
jgi:uncharacterized protein (UPF0332 family)